MNLTTYFKDSEWRTYPSGLGRDIDKWRFSVKIVQRQQSLVVLGWLMSSRRLKYLSICQQFATVCNQYFIISKVFFPKQLLNTVTVRRIRLLPNFHREMYLYIIIMVGFAPVLVPRTCFEWFSNIYLYNVHIIMYPCCRGLHSYLPFFL